jgi:hypothetical protein
MFGKFLDTSVGKLIAIAIIFVVLYMAVVGRSESYEVDMRNMMFGVVPRLPLIK